VVLDRSLQWNDHLACNSRIDGNRKVTWDIDRKLLSGDTQSEAINILKKTKILDVLSGRAPTGMAAAAIYIASVLTTERRTQHEVANVAGVTEVTIRNRYKELVQKLGLTIEI
jgi:transcription initiation factor TFIIB